MLKLKWISNVEGAVGNALGYAVHNDTLKKYTAKVAELADDAEDAIIIVAPNFYGNKVPGVVNWLFTMFEGTILPTVYADRIKRADFLLTPSTWVRDLFCNYFENDRIFVINHGVEPVFTYKARKFPKKRPFRYLWVGAPNPRKGWEEMIHLWSAVFRENPFVELYIKTTRVGGIQKKGNVIVDGRKLSIGELVKLYHDAHCFVFPTRGEGFGLTLAEAMRTGLPCISTYYSGVTDFFDDTVGFSVDHKIGEGSFENPGDRWRFKTEMAFPYVDQIVEFMLWVYKNYAKALMYGKKASLRITKDFTWERSAQTLVDIIEEHGGLKEQSLMPYLHKQPCAAYLPLSYGG